ncbi:phosphate ABC transporter permease subunit PstC [Sagittula sp. NFXS13]|uniref:Phosphate transport system permease protein n=1 Tax=Sagittula marina TaxID=943940 RepID=A0A7W6GS72_9RHOB|nr:phosphate ABC transporter permease subunit PstC [Sagittula marina]MBB3985308.1 phosphate transport system permease protein [Sagittula marina]
MPAYWLFLIVLAIAAVGFVLGRMRALQSAKGDSRALHSLKGYYGWNVALKVLIPALLVLVVWQLAYPLYTNATVAGLIPEASVNDGSSADLVLAEVRRTANGLEAAVASGQIADTQARDTLADPVAMTDSLRSAGQIVTSELTTPILNAAQHYRAMGETGALIRTVVVLLVAFGGLFWGLSDSYKDFRARNTVEQTVKYLLIAAASIAILTTLGIVLSLIGNTIRFFNLYPASEFFGSLTWQPSFGGGSELGIWPLLWGTLYISFVALLVAVPIGLFAAVYLSEYASPKLRAFAKPALEVLAGIPTIVYGLFALLTIGPLLISVFGPDGAGWMTGTRSVMTAGIAMGIMLIPFVSSLSDDIINAVPQAMRDGSYGLGATKSETVKQVVLPAALPGIVGAVLLAASRAIGETMIVVLGAGAAARLSLNPLEAMTTVTTRIVSQLTGDADFASPEALVAFALGMTLFVLTLGLNVFALYIVRTYREQYD